MSATDDIFAVIGEGAALLAALDENSESFFADLTRLREIIAALGEGATAAPALTFSMADKDASIDALYAYLKNGIGNLPDVLIPFEAQTVSQLAVLAGAPTLSNKAMAYPAENGKPLRDDDSTKLAVFEHFAARGAADAFTVEQHGFDRATLAQAVTQGDAILSESIEHNPIYTDVKAQVQKEYDERSEKLRALFRIANNPVRTEAEQNAAAEEYAALKKDDKPFLATLEARGQDAWRAAYADRAQRAAALLRAPGEAIVAKLLESTSVTADEAMAWAKTQIVEDGALENLKKSGYPLEQFYQDAADFYRMTGGKASVVRFHAKANRANANGIETTTGYKTIGVPENFNKVTLWHELAHHLENDPAAKAASNGFLLKRRESAKPHKLRKLTNSKFYGTDEIAWKDHFTNPYVGRIYPDGATEVYSMGVQYLSDPSQAAWFMGRDPEMFALVTGYITGTNTPAMQAKLSMHANAIGEKVAKQKAVAAVYPEAITGFAARITPEQDDAPTTAAPTARAFYQAILIARAKKGATPDYLGSYKDRYWILHGSFQTSDTKRFKSGGYCVLDVQSMQHVVLHKGLDTAKALCFFANVTGSLFEGYKHFFLDGDGRTAEEKTVSYWEMFKTSGI